jgi:hypothetical protein
MVSVDGKQPHPPWSPLECILKVIANLAGSPSNQLFGRLPDPRFGPWLSFLALRALSNFHFGGKAQPPDQ